MAGSNAFLAGREFSRGGNFVARMTFPTGFAALADYAAGFALAGTFLLPAVVLAGLEFFAFADFSALGFFTFLAGGGGDFAALPRPCFRVELP